MKYIIIVAMLLLPSCIVVEDYDPSAGYVYYDMCYADDPYYTGPEYCYELNYQSALCCTWHVGYDCYEDWCIWADMCSWEHISYDCGYYW